MAKDNKKLVQAITSQEENFAQWYKDSDSVSPCFHVTCTSSPA